MNDKRNYFDQDTQRGYILNTEKGPVVRLWVPFQGWYHIRGPIKQGEVLQAGHPADPTVLQDVVKAF